jgi:hypothetical protein
MRKEKKGKNTPQMDPKVCMVSMLSSRFVMCHGPSLFPTGLLSVLQIFSPTSHPWVFAHAVPSV